MGDVEEKKEDHQHQQDGNMKPTAMSKEAEISIAASSMFPGFRFSPTDEELILYYLKKKVDGFEKCVEVIPEIDICKYEPWDLPAKAVIKSDQEWFFFSPRGKKYPNGSQSKRATEIGYWKATGKERAVKSGLHAIGTKRTLVFHIGRAPKGERTEWIMHEYCMAGKGQDALVVCRLRRKCDYHPTDVPNGETNMRNSLNGSSQTYSGGNCVEPAGTSRGNRMAESAIKKSESSHDSHSVEQAESTPQSDWKLSEIMQPQCSSYSKHTNDEDDLFAEILNDNIVQLDECPPTSAASLPILSATTTVTVVPRAFSHPGHQGVSRSYPSQGTASRRIRLRKLRRVSPRKEELEEQTGENMVRSPSLRRIWGAQISKAPMRLGALGNRLYVVMIAVGLLILLAGYVAAPAMYPKKLTHPVYDAVSSVTSTSS